MQAHRIPPRSLLVLSLLLLPSLAVADGMFVWRNRGVDILEPEQKALIIQDAGWEDLVLEVKYQGKAKDFGWIVPVPSEPTLSAGDAKLFEILSGATQNNEPGHARMRGVTHESSTTTVLQQSRVGIYATATLSAQTGADLGAWLASHQYHVDHRAKSILDEYIAKGWLFVAARIAVPDQQKESALREGTIQPLRIRFASAEPIFPLRVSAAQGKPSEVLLYVISRHPREPTGDTAGLWRETYCGAVPSWTWSEIDPDSGFAGLRRGGSVLTKVHADISPARMRDVTFASIPAVDLLASGTMLQRAKAASILGAARDTSSVPALIRFLRAPGRDIEELRAGIWALGQIGTTEAELEVAHWIPDKRSVISEDAVATLDAMGSRAGIEECLAIVASGPAELPPYDPSINPVLHYLTSVLRPGDREMVDAALPPSTGLRRSLESYGRPALTQSDYLRLIVGDPETMSWYCDSLVSEGQVTGRPDDPASMKLGSLVQGFPRAFWQGAALGIGEEGFGSLWPLFNEMMGTCARFPDVRETILHRLAHDPRLPEAGRVIAISYTKIPTADEEEFLRQAWRSARGGAESHIHTGVRFGDDSIDYPQRACLAALAFGRLGGVSDLTRMWSEVQHSDNEDVLRGIVAYALAMTESTDATVPIVQYVRWTWSKGPSPLAYTDREITEFLRRQRCSPQLAPLIEDSSQPLHSRLFWISNLCLFTKGEGDLVPAAYAALKEIESSTHMDTGQARGSVDRYAAIRQAMVGY